MDQKKPITVFIIGCGQRGKAYAQYAYEFPQKMQVVAIAEPRKITREMMQQKYNVSQENVFENYQQSIDTQKKIADVVLIALQDKDHKEAAIKCAELGYHIILEKPMAVLKQDCVEITQVCQKYKVLLYICHVLRYAPWNTKIKELIQTGKIGSIANIQHYEPVGWEHFSHSYVRGNWGNTDKSTFSLMAKCCHDVDLVLWWAGSPCKKVSSFGNLLHFKKQNKPEKASNNCLNCEVEKECPYSAKKQYIQPILEGKKPKFGHVLVENTPDLENLTEAVKNGPYGRCVYECDNDVVDHQVVNFEFENGATSTLTMSAFTEKLCERKTHITGTHGEIVLQNDVVHYIDFRTKEKIVYECPENPSKLLLGHNGADYYLMDSFVNDLQNNNLDKIIENSENALNAHLLVFAAEESRLERKIVNL